MNFSLDLSRWKIFYATILNQTVFFCSKRTYFHCPIEHPSPADSVNFITTLSQQAERWSPICRIDDGISSLTCLALRVQKQATEGLLTLARLSEKSPWCHNFLESILQEAFTLANESRSCSVVLDAKKQHSQHILIEATHSEYEIVRQTALRLITLASFQSPHIFVYAITSLLSHNTSIGNRSDVEALAYFTLVKKFSNQKILLESGIIKALDHLLIDEFELNDRRIDREMNILKNLLLLTR